MIEFYTRQENEKEIVIVYTYRAISFYLLIPILIGFFIQNSIGNLLNGLAIILLVGTVILSWEPQQEVKAALKQGKAVRVTGNRFSFSDPVTVHILKG